MDRPDFTNNGSIIGAPPQGRSQRARLYYIFQASGWGFVLGVDLFIYLSTFHPPGSYGRTHSAQTVVGQFLSPVICGFLLTHFVRQISVVRGWKRFTDWRSLAPRIAATALVLSCIRQAATYAVSRFFLGCPVPPLLKLSALIQAIAVSWMFVAWLGLYFFYNLLERYHYSENLRLQLLANIKESELRSLKSQVNPHFIFNSLNCLRELIDADPPRANRAVTQLANLLRYSLQSIKRDAVAFDEELRIANDYLGIEQMRYEDRLRVRIDVSDDVLALPVPPLLLQPLIENSVKHGIARCPQGGEISIWARRDHGVLRLRVANPLASAGSGGPRAESTGTGLGNMSERLGLLFGERATLKILADTPGIYVVEIVLPLPASPAKIP